MTASSRRQRGHHSPYVFYGGISGILAVLATGLFLALGLRLAFSWLLGVNLITLAVYGLDKMLAGTKRSRVPERVLHVLALLGGSPGALAGQHLFRHKRQKGSFLFWFWLIVVLQAVALIAWFRLG
ncbi:DUF1294 domain-containing protein [Myxococcota bacterium]|nr:DUF1294 domain-containing protein [Myxococcota bacterium]MBU1537679.1 DUF1294 domain-containing protein [Myxococcota bacterium]